jgi:hypothetical protein
LEVFDFLFLIFLVSNFAQFTNKIKTGNDLASLGHDDLKVISRYPYKE